VWWFQALSAPQNPGDVHRARLPFHQQAFSVSPHIGDYGQTSWYPSDALFVQPPPLASVFLHAETTSFTIQAGIWDVQRMYSMPDPVSPWILMTPKPKPAVTKCTM